MATQKEISEILGKAMVDAEFRASLVADPTKAAAAEGVSLIEEQAAGLKASDLSGMAEGLDQRLSKYYHPPIRL